MGAKASQGVCMGFGTGACLLLRVGELSLECDGCRTG